MARILVVDDDDDIRELLELALLRAGHTVRGAENGHVALQLLDRFAADVILLDMRMPVMDGWAFVRAYRQRPGRQARLVVLTAARDARAWAAQVGADAYIAKPFDLTELSAVVEDVCPTARP